MQGRIHQVSLSLGGVPKVAVPEAFCTPLGLNGDGHNHPSIHGGREKAILLIALEDIEALKLEGFPLFPGALGENLTVAGIDFRQLRTAQRWRVGDAILELTTLRRPCATLDVYNGHVEGAIQNAVYDQQVKLGDVTSPRWARGGFYAAVIQTGAIRPGDTIKMIDQLV